MKSEIITLTHMSWSQEDKQRKRDPSGRRESGRGEGDTRGWWTKAEDNGTHIIKPQNETRHLAA